MATLGMQKLSIGAFDVFKYLTADMKDEYLDNQQPEHVRETKEDIRKLFENYIDGEFFSKEMEKKGLDVMGITTFGSSATPLASKTGDLDLCIWLKENGTVKEVKTEPARILRLIIGAICENWLKIKQDEYKKPELISHAKVPIITVNIYGYQVDLSVHIGDKEHPNSCAARLLSAYHLYNPAFTLLCFYVKEWLGNVIRNEENAHSAISSTPNSYCISILVAQFMQHYGLLPNLLAKFRDEFMPSSETTLLRKVPEKVPLKVVADSVTFRRDHKKELSEELGMIFYRFLKYFSNEVDLKHNALIVETAQFVPRSSVSDAHVKKQHALVIIDVFDKFNPGRRVMKIEGFQELLREAIRRIENAQNPHRITERLYKMKLDQNLVSRIYRNAVDDAKSDADWHARREANQKQRIRQKQQAELMLEKEQNKLMKKQKEKQKWGDYSFAVKRTMRALVDKVVEMEDNDVAGDDDEGCLCVAQQQQQQQKQHVEGEQPEGSGDYKKKYKRGMRSRRAGKNKRNGINVHQNH